MPCVSKKESGSRKGHAKEDRGNRNALLVGERSASFLRPAVFCSLDLGAFGQNNLAGNNCRGEVRERARSFSVSTWPSGLKSGSCAFASGLPHMPSQVGRRISRRTECVPPSSRGEVLEFLELPVRPALQMFVSCIQKISEYAEHPEQSAVPECISHRAQARERCSSSRLLPPTAPNSWAQTEEGISKMPPPSLERLSHAMKPSQIGRGSVMKPARRLLRCRKG